MLLEWKCSVLICVNISSHFDRFIFTMFLWDFRFRCNVTDYPLDCKPDQTKMCNNMESETFKKCAMKLGSEAVKAYLESCRIDACAYVQNSKLFESVVCSAIEAFAGECAKAGILVNWRRSDFCRKIYTFS